MPMSGRSAPPGSGLARLSRPHDGCGVALVARLTDGAESETVDRALAVLERLAHRGAEGADADTGDGAGILLQIPDAVLRASVDFPLPPPGRYGVATCFLSEDGARAGCLESEVAALVAARGLRVLGWREVLVDRDRAGQAALECAPVVRQLFIGDSADERPEAFDGDRFERRLYLLGRRLAGAAGGRLGVVSCSSRTIVYKGMLTAPQLRGYYPDLRDPRCASKLALVHARFSTNTAPSWQLAQPYHLVCHNGEFNTLEGNRNWMRARHSRLGSRLFGDELVRLPTVLDEQLSDSASLDAVLELMVRGGWPLPRAVMTLLPQAYERRDDVPPGLRDFFTWAEGLMEPWDGPALLAFADGRVCGASLDRNGLRPARWAVTRDGWLVLASEAGTLHVDSAQIVRKGRLEPGTLLVVDTETGRVSAQGEAEADVAAEAPYGEWVAARDVRLAEPPARPCPVPLARRTRCVAGSCCSVTPRRI